MADRTSGTERTLSQTNGAERTLGQLVADASTDVSGIVKGEIDLAKIEMKSEVQKAVKGGAMLAAAGVLALYMLGFLLTAGAWGLFAAGMSRWLSFLIVAGVLLVIVLILALVGKKQFDKMQGGPKATIDNAQKTVQAVKPAKG